MFTLGTKRIGLASRTGAAASVNTHFHLDPAATPLLATTAAGAVAWKENHRPYGDKLNYQAAAASNTIGYAGKPFDNATGLSYMGARYYNPVLGRFTGIDPVGFTEANLHSHNRYTYANNNPFKFVDPDGRNPVAIAFIGAIGISLAAQDAYNGYQSGGWPGVANSLATTTAFTVAFGIVGNATVAGVQAVKSALAVSSTIAKEAAPAMTTRVGRHMSPAEFEAMSASGKVQESLTGTTHVASPANPASFGAQAKRGTIYAEFDVPTNSLKPTSDGWAKVVGPNSLEGRMAGKKGDAIPQMPNAENISTPSAPKE
jgi:RHS repeat-associated protein